MSYLTCSVYCSHSTYRWCCSGQRDRGLIWGQRYFALVLETNHKNRLGKEEHCPEEGGGTALQKPFKRQQPFTGMAEVEKASRQSTQPLDSDTLRVLLSFPRPPWLLSRCDPATVFQGFLTICFPYFLGHPKANGNDGCEFFQMAIRGHFSRPYKNPIPGYPYVCSD